MSSSDVTETIVAIASAPGEGLRGIIRISGRDSLGLVNKLFKFSQPLDRHRNCTRRATIVLNEIANVQELPGQLLIWPTNRSYTRQPTAEFHTFGSRPLLEMVVQRFCEQGARLAQPGEFTLRAFLSGRIDLTQAEAVLAIIDSEGEQQLDRALVQLAGGMAGPLTELQNQLIDLLAELEAGLDFVEEDIEFVTSQQIVEQLELARKSLKRLNKQLQSRANSGELPAITIIGTPNAGKSSLFNSLLGRQQTIVSSQQGTTRDFVSAEIRLGAQNASLIDTAGIDPNNIQSEIDANAQGKARNRIADASIRLLCIDAELPTAQSSEFLALLDAQQDIVVLTKHDSERHREAATQLEKWLKNSGCNCPTVATSTKTGHGMATLIEQVESRMQQLDTSDSPIVHTTALRTANSLLGAEENVEQALLAAREDLGPELVASEIRQSLEQLAEVVGKVYTDDILDRIFSRFCIGK